MAGISSENGKIEYETFTCGECNKPVLTSWFTDGSGLLSSDKYILFGEVIFHAPECIDAYCLKIDQDFDNRFEPVPVPPMLLKETLWQRIRRLVWK